MTSNGLQLLQARQQHKKNLDVLKQFANVPYRNSNNNSHVFNWTDNNPIITSNKSTAHTPPFTYQTVGMTYSPAMRYFGMPT